MQAHTRGKNARRRNRTNSLTTYGQDNPFAGTTPAMRFKNQETRGVKLPRPPYTADAAFTRPNTGVRWLQVVDGLHSRRTGRRGQATSRLSRQGQVKTPRRPHRKPCQAKSAAQASPRWDSKKGPKKGPTGGTNITRVCKASKVWD